MADTRAYKQHRCLRGSWHRSPRNVDRAGLARLFTVPDVRQICSRRLPVANAGSEQTPEMRDTIKRLTKLFYFDQTPGSSVRVVQSGQIPALRPTPLASKLSNLPLWRVEWSVLPGSQEILHVMAPHYVHMFEGVFSRPRPWLFGHLYLPGGSKNLGSPAHALSSGSQAPLVGTLAQVTRAVRLRDGKFLILATAITRFKVCRSVQELPYSVADVELFEDCEVLEGFNQPALAAVMQAAAVDASINALMAAGSALARDVSAAVNWAWLRGYELSVAAQQEWPGPGPREGESDLETHLMVQELMAHGVSEVLPLPDGVVIGRVNLAEVVTAAEAAQQQGLQSAAELIQQSSSTGAAAQEATGPAGTGSTDDVVGIVSLNTTAERGVKFEGAEFSELISSTSTSSTTADVLMLEAAVWAQLDTLVALASRVKGNRHTLPFGLLQLRPGAINPQSMLWGTGPQSVSPVEQQEHSSAGTVVKPADGGDTSSIGSSSNDGDSSAAAAASRQQRQQQQPEEEDAGPEPPAAGLTADTSGTQSQGSQSAASGGRSNRASAAGDENMLASSKYAFAASDGMDVHADPLWPPLRRAARLSWAAAVVIGHMEQDKGELRQALLEAPSIAQRLRFVSAVLSKHVKVLSAIAAVKDVEK